ncbi:MAG: DUF192 domain-containing protein [Alphaproteobacteria bacterium]|nr:DUF192 domain-containing protein [Alphaproteobacteria bacterium]
MPKQILKWVAYLLIALSAAVIFNGLFVSGKGVHDAMEASSLKSDQLMIVTADKKQHVFKIELALTVDEQQKGLMNREKIADDYGMLFVYTRVQETSMWMKNTLIPLDMLFIDNNGKIVWIAENAKPFDERAISSHFPVRATLEIKGGQVAARGIKLGDTVFNSYFGNTDK